MTSDLSRTYVQQVWSAVQLTSLPLASFHHSLSDTCLTVQYPKQALVGFSDTPCTAGAQPQTSM